MMVRALRLSLMMLVASLVLGAGVARAATTCESAPGTSGLDQYCETIPGAGGGSPSVGGTGGGGATERQALPPAAARALDQPGAVNAGIRGLVAAGPAGAARTREARRRQQRTRRESIASAADTSGDPLRAVANSVKDGPTVSSALPAILLILAIVAASVAWLRRGREHGRSR